MKARQLPRSHEAKLALIKSSLEEGTHDHRIFRGKRLQQNTQLVSIPLGQKWRALFFLKEQGYRFQGCFSHEEYNKLHFNQMLP